MAFIRGSRVRVVNPKHRHYGKSGVIAGMDRGNVTVRLDDGTEFVTRMASLGEPPLSSGSGISERDRERLARRIGTGDPAALLRLFVDVASRSPSFLADALRALPVDVAQDSFGRAFPHMLAVVSSYDDDWSSASVVICTSREEAIAYSARLFLAVAKDEVASLEFTLEEEVDPWLEARRREWSGIVRRLERHIERGDFEQAMLAWNAFPQQVLRSFAILENVEFGSSGTSDE